MKYRDDAARITRVYPMRLGMKKNMLSWLIQGFFDDAAAAAVSRRRLMRWWVLPRLGVPFWDLDGDVGIAAARIVGCL